jgi:hypothetical protein
MQRLMFVRRISSQSLFLVPVLLLAFVGTSQAGYMADVLAQRPTPAPPLQQGDTQRSADAVSQGRAIQITPDTYDCLAHGQACGTTLFQANIGNERWSINGDVARDIFTGNVFFEGDDRPAVFLWCPIVGVQGSGPTSAFVLHCFAADNCAGGCFQSQWQDLGLVPLPTSYILP